MNKSIREAILSECKNGEQKSPHKSKIKEDWKLGKLLSYGVTPNGFPFIAWEGKDFGSICVGKSRTYIEPKSKLRNDASSGVWLNNYDQIMSSAVAMSERIIY